MGNTSAEWCNVSLLRGAAVQVPRVSFLRKQQSSCIIRLLTSGLPLLRQ